MSKKNLDELFQDTLLDFNEVPDDRVWASIEASLDKKKKKRVLPLWWALGGIAAALLIGLILVNPFDPENNTDQIITDVEQDDSNSEENTKNPKEQLQLNQSDEDSIEVATDDETDALLEETRTEIATDQKADEILKPDETQIATTENKETRSSDALDKTDAPKRNSKGETWDKNEEGLVQTKNSGTKNNDGSKNRANGDIYTSAVTAKTDIAKTGESIPQKNAALPSGELTNTVEKIVSDTKDTAVAAAQEDRKQDSLNSANKKSIFDEIESQEEEVLADKSTRKWSAGPSVAPVYFNAMGEGSSVHSIFVPNSKSGNINMSYGLSVAYELSPKLRVRSGVHRVDYGYDTNDIAFSSSPMTATNGQIDNINYRATSKNLVVSSKPGGSALEQSNVPIDAFAPNAERAGIMTQQLGYLEVPVELHYALIDQKFGLNVIGGVSSLFLVDNSVALTSGSLTTEMGDANNVNDLNFSANFGLGVNYKFSRNLQLNIEPVFKYQLNTFSQTNGTFNPYALGIYSGLSFKF